MPNVGTKGGTGKGQMEKERAYGEVCCVRTYTTSHFVFQKSVNLRARCDFVPLIGCLRIYALMYIS